MLFLALIRNIGMSAEGHARRSAGAFPRHSPLAIADGRQAIQVVRECASEWGISFESIGIIGFSIGGTVAMGAVGGQTPESRADFLAAIYAAALTGVTSPPPEPTPLFVLCANDDPIAAQGSEAACSKWKAAGYPAELHMFSNHLRS